MTTWHGLLVVPGGHDDPAADDDTVLTTILPSVSGRDTASRLGLTAAQIDNTLYDAFGQRQVSTIYEPLNQYHVVMVVAQRYWQEPSSLRDIYVSSTGGTVSGTQSTNAVAGTVSGFSGFSIGSATSSAAPSASSVAADAARNASMNAIATTGHGATSTGQAVSTVKETMVPLSAFTHYGLGTTPLAVNHQNTFVAGTMSLSDNVEMTLVSQNSASCTGDKDGDGEAIAFDDNHNRPGFAAPMVPVIAATSSPPVGAGSASIIRVKGSLIDTQLIYNTRVNVGTVSDYYVGDWLQVVRGTGLGQARKILAVSPHRGDGTVTLTVAPAFDVLPRTDSLVTDSRLYWQTYAIDNLIDHRRPPCLKSNSKRRAGGVITLSGATADSVVEGNTQYDTSGILLAAHFIESSNEIRNNTISGTYDVGDATPQAEYGIAVAYGAAPDAPPPLMSYGTAISHNVLSGVGGTKGAISLNRTWFTGPESKILRGVTPWKIADSTLIFDNTLEDIRPGVTSVGIGLSAGVPTAPVEWHTVLYGNRCNGTPEARPRCADTVEERRRSRY